MNILIKGPVISERSMHLAKSGEYTFLVDRHSRKPAIKQALEKQFAVKVERISTTSYSPRVKWQRNRRGKIQVPGYKKAVVRLKSGQKLPFFEAEAPGEEVKHQVEVKEKKNLLKGTKIKIEKKEK